MMRRKPNSDGSSSTTRQWMTSSLLPHILFKLFLSILVSSGSCEGFLKTCWSPARIGKDSSCQLLRSPHPQSSYYYLFTPTKPYTNPALSYSIASLEVLTSTDTATSIITTTTTTAATSTAASNLFLPASPAVPTNTLLVSDGFDPTGFFVNVLGGILNGPGILLVPIGAAVIVASTIAFLIINYSQPASPEEDSDDAAQNDYEDF